MASPSGVGRTRKVRPSTRSRRTPPRTAGRYTAAGDKSKQPEAGTECRGKHS